MSLYLANLNGNYGKQYLKNFLYRYILFSINGLRTGGWFKNVNITTDPQHRKKLK